MTERLHIFESTITVNRRPHRTSSPCSHLLCDRLPLFLAKTRFSDIPGKNVPHIGILAGFTGARWHKIGGKIQLDLKGLTSQ